MTKRDFFILTIKLFGMMSLVTLLMTVLSGYFSILYLDNEVIGTAAFCFLFVMVLGVFLLIVQYAPKIVEILKLDKGFDNDRIEFGNLSSKDIIRIGSYIVGAPIFINAVDELLYYFIRSFGNEVGDYVENVGGRSALLENGIRLVIGFLLITKYEVIANFLDKRKPTEESPDK